MECASSSDVYSAHVTPRFRRIVLAVAIVPLVLLIGLRSAWAAYACRIDGEVRNACCCPKKDKDSDRAPVETPRMSASCCCDITVGETADAPQARETDRGHHANDVALAFIATTLDRSVVVDPAGTRMMVHAFARPPPRSVPTYLANRAILR